MGQHVKCVRLAHIKLEIFADHVGVCRTCTVEQEQQNVVVAPPAATLQIKYLCGILWTIGL